MLQLLSLIFVHGYHKPNSFATPAPSAPTAAPVITTGAAATAPNTTALMVAAAAPTIPNDHWAQSVSL